MTLKVESHVLEDEERRKGKEGPTHLAPQNKLQLDKYHTVNSKPLEILYNVAAEKFCLRIPGKLETKKEKY